MRAWSAVGCWLCKERVENVRIDHQIQCKFADFSFVVIESDLFSPLQLKVRVRTRTEGDQVQQQPQEETPTPQISPPPMILPPIEQEDVKPKRTREEDESKGDEEMAKPRGQREVRDFILNLFIGR